MFYHSQYHQLCWWFVLAPLGHFVLLPKGGSENPFLCYWWPLKSGSLLLLFCISFQAIPLILLFYISFYRLFVYITDCFAIISSCPKVTVISLPILWVSVKYHKCTFPKISPTSFRNTPNIAFLRYFGINTI